MLSVFCASHSRLHWPVALRWRASLSSSICSRSFFQRRYSALSRPVMDMVMSTEPLGPGLRLCRVKRGHKERETFKILQGEVTNNSSGMDRISYKPFKSMTQLTVHSFSSSDPVFTLSKSSPPQFLTCLLLPSLRSVSGAGPERLGSSRKLRIGLSPSG